MTSTPFPYHLLYARNGCCSFTAAWVEGGISKPHSPGIPHAVWTASFFCLASLVFVSLGGKFFFHFPWPWRGCCSNPWVVFFFFSKSELTVWFWSEIRETNPAGEELAGGCSISAPDSGKAEPVRERTPNPPASPTVKRGPTPDIHQVHICFAGAAVWIFCFGFCFPWDRSCRHFFFSPPGCQPRWVFFLSLAFWAFLFCGGGICPLPGVCISPVNNVLLQSCGLLLVLVVNCQDSWRGSSTLNGFVGWYLWAWRDSHRHILNRKK